MLVANRSSGLINGTVVAMVTLRRSLRKVQRLPLLLDQLDEVALDLVLHAQAFQVAYELRAAVHAPHHRSGFHQQADGVLVAPVAGGSDGSFGLLQVNGRGTLGMFFFADGREPEPQTIGASTSLRLAPGLLESLGCARTSCAGAIPIES